MTNPCIQCGRERVVSKTWTETITSFSGTLQDIVHVTAVCPDALCQEKLNTEFAKQKEKRVKIAAEKEERLTALKLKKKAA